MNPLTNTTAITTPKDRDTETRSKFNTHSKTSKKIYGWNNLLDRIKKDILWRVISTEEKPEKTFVFGVNKECLRLGLEILRTLGRDWDEEGSSKSWSNFMSSLYKEIKIIYDQENANKKLQEIIKGLDVNTTFYSFHAEKIKNLRVSYAYLADTGTHDHLIRWRK